MDNLIRKDIKFTRALSSDTCRLIVSLYDRAKATSIEALLPHEKELLLRSVEWGWVKEEVYAPVLSESVTAETFDAEAVDTKKTSAKVSSVFSSSKKKKAR